jgi:hypothetical protein
MTDATALLGASPAPFAVLTFILFGGAALATGRALARHWRPLWQVLPYVLLLGGGDRFLLYALFDGDLLSPSGYAVAAAILLLFCLLAYRITLVRRMLRQYPWLYEAAGPFSWRERK